MIEDGGHEIGVIETDEIVGMAENVGAVETAETAETAGAAGMVVVEDTWVI